MPFRKVLKVFKTRNRISLSYILSYHFNDKILSKLSGLLNILSLKPNSINQLIKKNKNQINFCKQSISIDLGCGSFPKNPFKASKVYGVDIREDTNLGVKKADILKNGIPFDTNSIDFCTAFDFIEHIPRVQLTNQETKFPFVDFMNEVHRVLKPNGIFLHQTPAYPSPVAFRDPTHVNIITEETIPHYFCSLYKEVKPSASIYGFTGNFILIDQVWIKNSWIVSIVKAI